MSGDNSKHGSNHTSLTSSRHSPVEDPLINPSESNSGEEVVVNLNGQAMTGFTNAMVSSTGQVYIPLSANDVTWSNGIPMVAYNSTSNGMPNMTVQPPSVKSQQSHLPPACQNFGMNPPGFSAPGTSMNQFLNINSHVPVSPKLLNKAGKDPNLVQRDLQLSRGKLKATSRTSALLAGFAMVALVELDYPNDTAVPRWMLLIFAIITTMLVSVHLLALMMSTCILPHLEAPPSDYTGTFKDSPHERLRWYIEASWLFSTCLGLLLFLLDIAVVFWLKFVQIRFPQAAYVTTSILIPVFVLFLLFTCTFYRKLTGYHTDRYKKQIDELQQIWGDLETAGGNLQATQVSGSSKTSMTGGIKIV